MKTCNKCNVPKAENQFDKGRNACKECRYNYKERKDYFSEYHKERRKNPEVVEKAKVKRKSYKDVENARNREYHQKNKDEINRKRREKRALKK